jgi:surface polysaccharide O-acyltransferase-like enzyme
MKTRNYGIDFLRMISMIMIVMLHTLGHGGILRSVSFYRYIIRLRGCWK